MSEIQKTTDYDQFRFREDNRERITQNHVKRLADSIKARNLLELRPISVNMEMEVIDGQNRLLAAKMLGVPIYFTQSAELKPSDIIVMNVAQNWGMLDYLNYYCKNGYYDYILLKNFMNDNRINLKVAINITMGINRDGYISFKKGEYKFKEDNFKESIEICWETIDYIKRMNGYSAYVYSGRFWNALLKLIRHANFDSIKWRENLKRMVERFTAKANQQDYLKMFMDVHNWRNSNKVEID